MHDKIYSSITNNLFKKTELRIKCALLYLKIVYEYSKNTKLEKDMANILLTYFIKFIQVNQNLHNMKNQEIINYFSKLIIIYLECKFINKENKFILEDYKSIIKNEVFKKTIGTYKYSKFNLSYYSLKTF